MTLYEQFIEFAKQNGINTSDMFHEKTEKYDMVAFGEEAIKDNKAIYNVVLVFYDIEDVTEVYIRKQIKYNNRNDVLEKLNDYNACFRGMSFFLDYNFVNVKSFCVVKQDVKNALNLFSKNMEIAQELFKEFESY